MYDLIFFFEYDIMISHQFSILSSVQNRGEEIKIHIYVVINHFASKFYLSNIQSVFSVI